MNQESPAPTRRRRIICVALLGLCGALVIMALLLYDYARADVLAGPLPAPHPPRDIIQLTPVEKLEKFYNRRNIAVDASGKEIAFDLRTGPPAGYTALFPPPEVLENVQNVAGATPAQATTATESNGQVGNLQLSSQQEDDLVNLLKILSDGYTKPNPVSP